MTNNLNKLQEETREKFMLNILPKLEKPLYEYNFGEGHENVEMCVNDDLNELRDFIKQAQLLAYNLGVKDSVEALPEFYRDENDVPYFHENDKQILTIGDYHEEAITNITKLMQ